eukprot:scaffold210384_cov33-Tisochrysis_lutea.AAC.2
MSHLAGTALVMALCDRGRGPWREALEGLGLGGLLGCTCQHLGDARAALQAVGGATVRHWRPRRATAGQSTLRGPHHRANTQQRILSTSLTTRDNTPFSEMISS